MSVKGYSDYEQLAGGVETLFKKSSQSVINNASKAYQTAGMSANEYMETVTGFSASLLQSLGGDTQKATEKADTAIRDMSDNANKMGTDITSIQNAYQGFAKQNYTMLDNLKLGYGGTKEEMERLIKDANRVKEANGEMGDLSINSFADIVEAIHTVQNEMGITGTTAEEASSTIQGSISSMQAAWTNLITGLADPDADLDALINGFVDSVTTVGENIIPKIEVIINGTVKVIEKLTPKIIEALSGIIEKILPKIVAGAQALLKAFVGVLPQFVKLITKILPDIIKAVASIFKGIVNALPDLVKPIAKALPTLIPQIVTALIDMAAYLLKHIGEILQPIIDNLPDIIKSLVSSLLDNLPILIDGLISMCVQLAQAQPQIILALLDALPDVISMIIDTLLGDCLPQLIEGLIQVVMEVVSHIPEIIAGLIQAIPKVVSSIVEGLFSAASKIWEAFTSIFSKAWDGICGIFENAGSWFSDIFSGAAGGIETAWQNVTGFFSGIWDGITGVFSGIGRWFGKIFTDAVDNIKKAWSGVTDFFSRLWQGIWLVIKTPINWIIDGINTIIGGLNSLAIDVPDWVPFVGGQHWGISIPEVPKLARGGVVKGGMPFIAGEAGAEAVIPLENNKKWISRVANEMVSALGVQPQKAGLGRNFNQTFNVTVNVGKINDDLDINNVVTKISEQLAQEVRRKENLYA